MQHPMWIAGGPVRAAATQLVELPFDGSPVAEVFRGTRDHVDSAVRAAQQAFPTMREMSREDRASILRRAHQKLRDSLEHFAQLISSESGKPIKEARLEADRAAWTLLFSAEEAHRLAGEVVPLDAHPGGRNRWAMTIREPLGVIAAITPFNFPLNLSMHKIGPALAAGNTIVHKPATTTPLSALALVQLFEECGLPPGALNVVTGPGGEIGDAFVTHPGIAMVTFTGSPEVGVRMRSLAGMKRVTLELGNNSAVIIEADANLDAAIPRCVTGAFAHSGQVCISVQRIFVNESIRSEFTDRFLAATAKLTLGHPHDPATDISSLITIPEAERVESWIAEATAAGAQLLTGGQRRRATITPAVLAGVPETVSLSCREAFGPVVVINSYKHLDDAIASINRSDYGLQAGIYTRDLDRAFSAARRVHVGGFMINEVPQYRVDNMPYGGVKLSGSGREGPRYAIEEMTEPKLITWNVS
ncbi:MAG: aldehyde dehydrogenase family protein [Acidobacteria bacterium]|nr:aldehyde dehydrogenase family protein [Acidobacteriota bacterium]